MEIILKQQDKSCGQETARRYQQWWDDMADKYRWEGGADQSWEIQFDTCEIYLK